MASSDIPSAHADLATMWEYLKEGMNEIMLTGNGPAEPSYARYTGLHSVVYNYCSSSKTPSTGKQALNPLHAPATPKLDLYNNLTCYFGTYSRNLCSASDSLQGEALLQYYAQEWDRYTYGANFINRLFGYFNRVCVAPLQAKGRIDVYTVYVLALVQWRSNFFLHLADPILCFIERQRGNEQIDQALVKRVVESFVSLGLGEGDITKATYEVYKNHCEEPFLEAIEKYYRQESETFLAENSVPEYLTMAEGHLQEEERRVERYLNTTAREGLITRCEHVLIREHSELMWESFQGLLDSDEDADLQRMYALLARIPEGLEPLLKNFQEHVKKAWRFAVAKLMDEGADVGPKAYVNALLEVYNMNAQVVGRNFKGDASFLEALDKVCRELASAKGRLLEEEYRNYITRIESKSSEDVRNSDVRSRRFWAIGGGQEPSWDYGQDRQP